MDIVIEFVPCQASVDEELCPLLPPSHDHATGMEVFQVCLPVTRSECLCETHATSQLAQAGHLSLHPQRHTTGF